MVKSPLSAARSALQHESPGDDRRGGPAVEPAARERHGEPTSGSRSPNVLVLVDGGRVDELVHAAGEYAAGTGGRVVLLCVHSPTEFASRRRAFARIDALPRYTVGQAEEGRRQAASRLGRSVLAPMGVDFTAVGAVGREAGTVLATARRFDCGHLFLVAPRRSPLRRLLTTDVVRTVAARFDGLVTTLPSPPRAGPGPSPAPSRTPSSHPR